MHPGKALVLLAITLSISLHVLGLLLEWGWGADPEFDQLLETAHSIPARVYDPSIATQVLSSIIVLGLCWALYYGYPWARILLLLSYTLAVLASGAAVAVYDLPLLPDDLTSALFLVFAASSIVCLFSLLAPWSSEFLRAQRARRQGATPAA